jgi:LuxR family maltose regulon positive regulatory protein
MVARPELVERLTAARDAALALLVAPPGYGKSTLLDEWARADGRPFYTMGFGADAELTAGAGRSALGAEAWSDADAMAALAGRTTRGTANAVGALLRSLEERHGGFVLVIDDAQAFAPDVLRRVVEPMLRMLPPGATIAVASRSEPALPVGRLRAHRAIVEVRMDDFAMTAKEAAALLRGAGASVDFAGAQALARQTEGWPAALYLESLPDAGQLLEAYLHEEVLSTLGPALTNFALRTAVLTELSGASCDAVLKEPNSARKLAKLSRATALLEPQDAAHETYRWNGLVRDVLLADLRLADRPLEARLHVRASDHYARAGDSDRAIEHAVAAANVKRAGALITEQLPVLVGHGRIADLARWLSALSEKAVAGSPDLSLAAAHVALAQGDAVRAQYHALLAEGSLERGAAADLGAIGTGLAVIEASIARGGAARMADVAERTTTAQRADSAWRPVLYLLRGTSAHLRGATETAHKLLEQGTELGRIPAPAVSALCLAQRAMIALGHDDVDAAVDFADEARALVAAGDCPAQALVFAAAAAARARQGRTDEAKHDLRQAAEQLAHFGDYVPWYGAETRTLMAHASLWLADVAAARALLAEASRLARKVPDATIFEHWFDQAWGHLDSLAERALAGPSTLTIAELRILRFLPSHRSFREIAAQLGVSANTVKTQAHAVYRKLGVASRSEAVARATEAGLLAP